MKVDQVSVLPPVERFLYWIKERHSIYLKKQAGEFRPWTDDKILQSYFFCNVYRELDKTTVWFRENMRESLRDLPQVLFATVCFRWFNYIPTGELLIKHNLHIEWDSRRAIRILCQEEKIFTGAFMIPAPRGSSKLTHVCERLDYVRNAQYRLVDTIRGASLQEAHEFITSVPWLGNFMAYEVVTDLRHTYLLEDAPDIMTWANPGPGCIRGLRRLSGLPLSAKGNSDSLPRPKGWQQQMQDLLVQARLSLPDLPVLEMREIEHSLCEWDKYERARLQDGKMKRKYKGI